MDFSKLMTSLTEEELLEYIDNSVKYTPDAVFEAIKQLQSRGKSFTESEINIIKAGLSKQEDINKKRIQNSKSNFIKWAENFDFENWFIHFSKNRFNKLAFILTLVYVYYFKLV